MSKEVVKISNITKEYKLYQQPRDRFMEVISKGKKNYHKNFMALDRFSLEVKRGETVGIIGRNGSGKSTLLKIITGVLNPTSGEVSIDGRISALLELGAGFNMEYTGIENVYQNGLILGFSEKEMEDKLPEIIAFADIGDFLYQPVKTYSSGMLVRLAFSVAISVEPDILIVDEALAVGDTRFQLKCMNKFTELQQKGVTILFVSHDINAVKRFCSRTVWLDKGKMIEEGETDSICEDYLDFLRKESAVPLAKEIKDQIKKEESQLVLKALESVDIAAIEKVEIKNSFGEPTESINFGEDVEVEVQYLVKDNTVKNPVLGIAIYSIENEYICGLNTLLDSVKIPWNIGKNRFSLQYKDFNLIGGSYYLDVALYDQTATVRLDYQTRVIDFFVKEKYIGEGKVILRHKWR